MYKKKRYNDRGEFTTWVYEFTPEELRQIREILEEIVLIKGMWDSQRHFIISIAQTVRHTGQMTVRQWTAMNHIFVKLCGIPLNFEILTPDEAWFEKATNAICERF